ncbi:MAG: TVP38/TMEM64 family protein [Gemmatimonadaceae bacterium]|nr:TVP38/TMEM64 family protein [Gemmatimonadaceae bacterium]
MALTSARPSRRWLIAGVCIAALVGLLIAGRELAGVLPAVTRWVESLGAAAPVLFVLVYAAASVALIPASILTVAAGATFGLGRGVLYVMIGASLGAVGGFLIARYVARERVERRLAADPRLRELDRAVGASGLKIMFLMRLSPAFPFGLQNYALGLTSVRLRDYVPALAGMLPGTLLYVYAGSLAKEVAAVAGGVSPPRGAAYYLVLGLGLVATLAVTIVITRIARHALAARGAAQT